MFDYLYKISEEGFFINRIYQLFGNYIYKPICKCLSFIDTFIIGGIEKLISLTVKIFAVLISKMQTGSLQSYLLSAFIGIVLAIGFIVFYYFKIKGF